MNMFDHLGVLTPEYHQVIREEMDFYDRLPPLLRKYMQENISHLPAEDVLDTYLHTCNKDEQAALEVIMADNAIIEAVLKAQDEYLERQQSEHIPR